MNRWSNAAFIAAVVAFVLAIFEFGLVGEGLAWAAEDFLGLSPTAHRATAVIVGALILAFAVYAARRAYHFNAAEAAATAASDSAGERS